jgi:anti-sigma factor RsiW
MTDDTANPISARDLETEFVAYLDGEADVETSRKLEQLIAGDERARQRLQALERAWEALDLLPAARASEQFAATTVEMIALAEDQEVCAVRQVEKTRNRGFLACLAFVVIAVASFGFALTSRIANRGNQRLLQDLTIIENLDAYRQAGDIEFLRRLAGEGLFTSDSQHHANPGF